jgi:altronate dehydratase large subunit
MTWLGYKRPDGSYGARNFVLIIPGGIVADEICHFVRGSRTLITPQTPGGRPKADRETFARVYTGLAKNPNVASVIVNGTGTGRDYPEAVPELLAEEIRRSGKRVEVLNHDGSDTMTVIVKGINMARQLVWEASKLRREPCADSHLAIGVKCGASDPTSGIAGNPVVGYVYDKLVKAGGTAFFGESTEIIGAEHVLAKRAINKDVAEKILGVADRMDELAKASGEDIRTINPVPANIKAGISTLEEKSLGAIHKSGSMPIQGVLKYAETPKGKGLYFVDNWMWTLSIFLGYAAAGAQVVLYQLGGGGVGGDSIFYQTGGSVAPLIWCSANPKTLQMGGWNLDHYSGTIIEGKETMEEVGERLYKTILGVASGTMTRSETVNHVDPNEIYTSGHVF